MEHETRRLLSIEINGVRYDRIEDVPPELRKFVDDKNKDGIPDFLEPLIHNIGPANIDVTQVRIEQRVTGSSSSMEDLVLQRLLHDKNRSAKVSCGQCGYDLSATPVGSRCPECGQEVSATLLKLAQRRHRYQAAEWLRDGTLIRTLVLIAVSMLAAVIFLSQCRGWL